VADAAASHTAPTRYYEPARTQKKKPLVFCTSGFFLPARGIAYTTAPSFASFFFSGLIRSARVMPSHMTIGLATSTEE